MNCLKHFIKHIFKGGLIPPLVIIEFPCIVSERTLDEIEKIIKEKEVNLQ